MYGIGHLVCLIYICSMNVYDDSHSLFSVCNCIEQGIKKQKKEGKLYFIEKC